MGRSVAHTPNTPCYSFIDASLALESMEMKMWLRGLVGDLVLSRSSSLSWTPFPTGSVSERA